MGMGYGFGHPRDEKAERAEKLARRSDPKAAVPEKRKGGRPKGSKNKAKAK